MQLHPSLVAGQPLRPDAAETGRLWSYYVAHRDEGARAQLIALYTPFARMLAAKVYARRVFSDMEFGDYLQYALVGLLESVERFEPQRDILFETFAAHRINGAIFSGIEASSDIQSQIVARKRLVGQRVAALAAAEPDDGGDVFTRLAELAIGLAVGFALEDTGMHQPEPGQYADNSYTGVELKQLQERVRMAVGQLDPRHQQVMHMHYLQQHTFVEVAASMALSRARIAQIHKEALAVLRTLLYRSGELDIRC